VERDADASTRRRHVDDTDATVTTTFGYTGR